MKSWFSCVAIVGLCLLAACEDHASGQAQAPAGKPPPLEVNVVRVAPHDLPWTPVHLAQTSASREVEIRARVQGLLIERTFTEGSFVHRGDVLYRIDPRTFEAAKLAAQAALAQSKLSLEQSTRTVARKEQLVGSESVPRRELEDAQTAQALAKAQIQSAEAQLAQAELELEFTVVTAPMDGRIGKVAREQGTLVDTGANSLLTTMWRLDPLYVSFRISERELLQSRQALESGEVAASDGAAKGDLRVALELIDHTLYPHEGVINYRSAQVDPTTGTAEARAEVPNPEEALLPGQFVRVRVLGLTRRNVISVPQRAVQMGAASTVYVVNGENVVQSREIVLSTWEGSDWIVESGLEAGERVIVDGIQKVRPGSTVKPVESTKPNAPATSTEPAKSAAPVK